MFIEILLNVCEYFFKVLAWILTISSAICAIIGIIGFFTIIL
jgi:hypothetical protein